MSVRFAALEWQSFVLCRLGLLGVFSHVWDAIFALLQFLLSYTLGCSVLQLCVHQDKQRVQGPETC